MLEPYVVQAWHFEDAALELPADVVALSVPEILETEANLFFTHQSGFTNGSESAPQTLLRLRVAKDSDKKFWRFVFESP